MNISGSRGMGSNPGKFADAATIAATTSYYFLADTITMLSLQVHIAAGGSLVAACNVSVSDSYQPGATISDEANAPVAGNWVDITAECAGIVAITGAGAQEQMIVVQRTGSSSKICATWVKLTITRTSGTGMLSGWFHGKST